MVREWNILLRRAEGLKNVVMIGKGTATASFCIVFLSSASDNMLREM